MQGLDGAATNTGATGPTGPKGFVVPNRDRTLFALGSDQTVGQGGNFIGLGSQGDFDQVALPLPVDGEFTDLVFSIKQKLGMGGTPISPGNGETVSVYVVIAPYNNPNNPANTYGSPEIKLSNLEDFLDAWEVINGTLAACTGIAEQELTTPLDGGGDPYLPIGTRVGLKTVLDDVNKHCAICTGAAMTAAVCDVFTIWVRPDGFTSFHPSVTVIYATQ